MDKAYLILRFDAVFQSYSTNRTEKLIKTSLYPTKSAVIGLLGCCFGYYRGSKELIELCDGLTMGVRMDRAPTKLLDYQTIHGRELPAYDFEGTSLKDKKGNVKKGLLSASGVFEDKPTLCTNSKGGVVKNKVTTKEYLMDSIYTIILEGSKELIYSCAEAVENPVWVYHLGRNNCFPSIPITGLASEEFVREDFDNILDGLQKVSVLHRKNQPVLDNQTYVYELELSYAEKKKYPMGTVKEVYDNTGVYVNYDYRKRYVYSGSLVVNSK